MRACVRGDVGGSRWEGGIGIGIGIRVRGVGGHARWEEAAREGSEGESHERVRNNVTDKEINTII